MHGYVLRGSTWSSVHDMGCVCGSTMSIPTPHSQHMCTPSRLSWYTMVRYGLPPRPRLYCSCVCTSPHMGHIATHHLYSHSHTMQIPGYSRIPIRGYSRVSDYPADLRTGASTDQGGASMDLVPLDVCRRTYGTNAVLHTAIQVSTPLWWGSWMWLAGYVRR